jgi:uncharacterized DUF497 family protein
MIMDYDFEWDSQKAKINLGKHGVSFEEATTVFKDCNALTMYDLQHSKTEERYITMGITSMGRLLVVVHTYNEITDDVCIIRIISSRKATNKEEKYYTGD